MDKQTKRILCYIAFGVGLFALLNNLGSVWAVVKTGASFLVPVFGGLLVAFILSVPMKGFENLLLRLLPKDRRPRETALQAAGLLLTLLSVVVVLVLAFTLVIPEIVRSVRTIADLVVQEWPSWMEYLDEQGFNTSQLSARTEALDVDALLQSLSGSAGALLGSIMDTSASILSGLANAGIALVIAVYLLLSRRSLARKSKKLLYAYLAKPHADRVCHIAGLVQAAYTKFLSGQCIEACILGVLIFLAFSAFGLPYAGLIGFLTAISAFIPYVGAFVACVIGALLILLSSPEQALISVLVFLVVQFVENQFIYPNVVGTSVGLPPLFTFLAALIGGNLFGLFGMIFSIPLASVLYALLREDANRRAEGKVSIKNDK